MISFKKSLPRRTFLRGAGASIALPFISAMVPALTAQAQTAASRPRRAGFVYVPNGMVMTDKTDWWTPTTVGKDFELTRTLKPLEKFRDRVTVVSGLLGADGAGQHTGAATAWLTDMYPKKTQGVDVEAGTSIDQVIARHIGQDTVFPSMQMAIEDVSNLTGTCDTGYACVYLNTVSWSSPTSPMPMQINPRVVFERVFGGAGTAEQRLARMQEHRSILDSVLGEVRRIGYGIGPSDRARMEDYLQNVREVERRIELAENRNDELAASAPAAPLGVPPRFRDHVEVMFDLLHLIYQADITRVFSFMMARELSSLTYPDIGVPDPHHPISHHQDSEETMEKKGKVDEFHMRLFANFVDKLASTPDGDGSLLDNTLLMYGAGMSNGNAHSKVELPEAIVSGFVPGNRHIAISPESRRPIGDLHVDIARQLGVDLPRFGRSDGRTVGLG